MGRLEAEQKNHEKFINFLKQHENGNAYYKKSGKTIQSMINEYTSKFAENDKQIRNIERILKTHVPKKVAPVQQRSPMDSSSSDSFEKMPAKYHEIGAKIRTLKAKRVTASHPSARERFSKKISELTAERRKYTDRPLTKEEKEMMRQYKAGKPLQDL